MKRFIFSVITLMVAATSCTESGIIDMPEFYGNPISFDTYIGKNPMTKADNVDINYLKSSATAAGARIYAYTCESDVTNKSADIVDFSSAYLDGRLLWHDDTDNEKDAWQYNILKNSAWVVDEPYMPSGKDLAVVAYNLGASNGTTPCISNETATGFTFTVKDNVADQVDLLATPLTFVSENVNGDTEVPIRFYHLLSRVGFKVLSTSDSATEIKISSIKLRGAFPKKGYVSLISAIATPTTITAETNSIPAITAVTEKEEDETDSDIYAYEYNLFASGAEFSIASSACVSGTGKPGAQPIFNNKSLTATSSDAEINAAKNARYIMLMPGVQSNLSVEVTYKLEGQSTPNVVNVNIGSINFQAGYAYEFVLKIATAAIEFSGVVAGDWTSAGSDIPLN